MKKNKKNKKKVWITKKDGDDGDNGRLQIDDDSDERNIVVKTMKIQKKQYRRIN